MAQRVRIGANPNLGDSGYFMSQRGDNVTAPIKNLIVDSRYPTLSVHQNGGFNMDSYTATGTPQRRLYYGTVTFPSLGYVPIFQFSFEWVDANSVGITPNTSFYPSSWGSQDSSGFGNAMGDTNGRFYEAGCWLEGLTTLRAKCWLQTGAQNNVRMNYTIFRNRETT